MGIGFQLLERAGRLIEHGVGILLLAWRRVLRAMLVGGLVGILLAEFAAAIVTRQVPPGIPAQVAALVFGGALAYAAGLTMLADELLRGAIDTVRLLEGEAEAGARAVAIIAEREVGEIRLGRARGTPHTRRAARGGGRAGVPISLQSSTDDAPDAPETSAETLEAIAATDEFTSTAPRPRINARPVRADQLPRIPWAYEQRPEGSSPIETNHTVDTVEAADAVESAETLPSLAVPDVDPLPPLPLKPTPTPVPQVESAERADPAASKPTHEPASPAPFIVTLAPQPSASQQSAPQESAPGMPATETPSLEARTVPVVSQPHDTDGEQLADSAVSPARAAESAEAHTRGVWSRISQTLAGTSLVEPAEWTDPATDNAMSPPTHEPAGDIPPALSSDSSKPTHEAE